VQGRCKSHLVSFLTGRQIFLSRTREASHLWRWKALQSVCQALWASACQDQDKAKGPSRQRHHQASSCLWLTFPFATWSKEAKSYQLECIWTPFFHLSRTWDRAFGDMSWVLTRVVSQGSIGEITNWKFLSYQGQLELPPAEILYYFRDQNLSIRSYSCWF